MKHRYTKTQAMYLSESVLPDDVDMFGMGVSLDDDVNTTTSCVRCR